MVCTGFTFKTEGVDITELSPVCLEGRLIYAASFDPALGQRRLTGAIQEPPPPKLPQISNSLRTSDIPRISTPPRVSPSPGTSNPLRVSKPSRAPKPSKPTQATQVARSQETRLFFFGIAAGVIAAMAFGQHVHDEQRLSFDRPVR